MPLSRHKHLEGWVRLLGYWDNVMQYLLELHHIKTLNHGIEGDLAAAIQNLQPGGIHNPGPGTQELVRGGIQVCVWSGAEQLGQRVR